MYASIMLVVAFPAVSVEWNNIPLVRDLLITMAARERMHDEFMGLQADGLLSRLDRSDFQTYINRLDLRIAARCREVLIRYPGIDSADLPCIPVRLASPLPDTGAEQTPGEAMAALDAALTDDLAEFDEMLLSEQKKVAAKPPRVSSGSGYGDDGQGNGEQADGVEGEGGPGGAQGDGESDSEGGRQESGQTYPYGSGVGNRAGRRGSPPEDIPDGSKDDIVARQLREAAEKETDPELKRKLWDEYRRYKASIR